MPDNGRPEQAGPGWHRRSRILRIYFTADDIARTRLAPALDPLWELVLALQMLRPQRGDLLFGAWRRNAVPHMRQARLAEMLPLLLALTPTIGYFPDFLNPADSIRGLDHGLEAIRTTPVRRLAADLGKLSATKPLPPRARPLAAGDPATLISLTDALARSFDVLVTPHRRALEAAVGRDRQARAHALAVGGVEELLRSFRPMMSWSAGELAVPGHRDQELHLDGRGLLLIPAYFCVGGPLTMFDPELPPVLVYPVERDPDVLPMRTETASLAALMGTTRAAALAALRHGPLTTTELARTLNISLASASQHLTVLRQAGLALAHRDRHRMLHQLTALGSALLDGRSPTDSLRRAKTARHQLDEASPAR
ncbi:helix-turn-helix domain-containing protein [Nonomuraea africana]|uniref:helix-turn-helix domain-containing protein n=1 Tax=Nonomuraea africana TaxID=46171 RepID=UPI0033FEDCFB